MMNATTPSGSGSAPSKKVTKRWMLGHNQACRECRSRHKGCDGARPVCGPCKKQSSRARCTFDTEPLDYPDAMGPDSSSSEVEARLTARLEAMEARLAEAERNADLSRQALGVILRAAPWLCSVVNAGTYPPHLFTTTAPPASLQPASTQPHPPAAYMHVKQEAGIPSPLDALFPPSGAPQPPPSEWFRDASPAGGSTGGASRSGSGSSSSSNHSPELLPSSVGVDPSLLGAAWPLSALPHPQGQPHLGGYFSTM